jgi:hypothetical protein
MSSSSRGPIIIHKKISAQALSPKVKADIYLRVDIFILIFLFDSIAFADLLILDPPYTNPQNFAVLQLIKC